METLISCPIQNVSGDRLLYFLCRCGLVAARIESEALSDKDEPQAANGLS